MYTLDELKKIAKMYSFTYGEIQARCNLSISTVQKALGGVNKGARRSTLTELTKAVDRLMNDNGYYYQPYESESSASYVSDIGADYIAGSSAHADTSGKLYTYDDYAQLELPPGKRVEVIDGVLYDMAASTVPHQLAIGYMYSVFRDFIRKNKGPCRAILSPVDVRLEFNKGDRTILQPDLLVICDREKLNNEKSVLGAPDFVLEVLSPSTRKKDMNLKLRKYRENGVREYWMLDMKAEILIKTVFADTETSSIHTFSEQVPVAIYDGALTVDLPELQNECNL